MNAHEPTVRTYLMTYALLLAGLAATVAIAYLPHGRASTPLAMSVAGAKAGLVVLVFMHVRYAPPLTWIVVASGIIWLGLLIALVRCDYSTRDWAPTREPAGSSSQHPAASPAGPL